MLRYLVYLFMAGILLSACDKGCEDTPGQCAEEQLAADIVIIEEYLEENNLEAIQHPSGLFYRIQEEGTGELPNTGQIVSVNYVGKFLDGRVFDTSVDSVAREAGIYNENRNYKPFEFTLGRDVITGWTIGISLLKEGSTATLIIPSGYAYGSNGSGSIPPNTVLLFEVELVDIKF